MGSEMCIRDRSGQVKKGGGSATKVDALKLLEIRFFRGDSQVQFPDQSRFHRRHRLGVGGEMEVAVMACSSAEWNVNVNPKHAPKFAPNSA